MYVLCVVKYKKEHHAMKLIGIVGTNSAKSTNRQLLQYMQSHFADKAEIELVEIKDLPTFNKPADHSARGCPSFGRKTGGGRWCYHRDTRVWPFYSSSFDECLGLGFLWRLSHA